MKSSLSTSDTAEREPVSASREARRTGMLTGLVYGASLGGIGTLQSIVNRSPRMLVQHNALHAAFGNALMAQYAADERNERVLDERVPQDQAPAHAVPMNLIGDLARQTMASFLSLHSLSALLTFADKKALDALKSYSTFKTVYDKAVGFSNALGIAINIWDSIPSPVRTGILFLTGKFMHALPVIDALKYTEEHIVDADKDVKSTYLVRALDLLKRILKLVNSPVSSFVDLGQYVYSWWFDGSKRPTPEANEAQPTSLDSRRSDLARLDLKIIWLDVKALHLEKGKQEEAGKDSQEGGLHADFAFGIDIFDLKRSLGEKQQLTLILPWSGGVVLNSKGAVSIIDHFTYRDLFEIDSLEMTTLKVSNHGLQQLSLSLGELGIANKALSMKNARAAYKKGAGMTFAGDMGLKIYGWDAQARLGIRLDENGKFKAGTASNFRESTGTVKIESAMLDDDGFSISNAVLNLQPSTGLNLLAKLNELHIKQSTASGVATIEAADLPLLGENIRLTKAAGEVGYHGPADWDVKGQAALAMKFSHMKASGDFSIGYQSSTRVTSLQLKNGSFSAEYAGVSVSAEGMGYDHANRTFTLDKAQILVPAINARAAVDGVSIDKDGLHFQVATVAYDEPISPFTGLTIDHTDLTLKKTGDALEVSAGANLKVDIGTPMVKGEATGLRLAFGETGMRGELAELKLNTNPFDLTITNASLSKDELGADDVTLKFNTGGDKADQDSHEMIKGLKHGLLDFIPFKMAFKAQQAVVNAQGFSIGKFTPQIEAVSFKAFGFGGQLDFENMTAEVSAKHQLSLAQMTGLPLSAHIFFPIVPGLEVYGSLAADANLATAFNLTAGAKEKYWAVGGKLNVNADIGLTAGFGVQAGSSAIVALSIGGFAEGKAKLTDASAGIAGKTRYDRSERKFIAVEPLHVNYNFGATASVSVGGEISARALYFYKYTIYRYTAAQWTLGEYKLAGKLGDTAGELKPEKATTLGLASKTAAPAPTETFDAEKTAAMLRSNEKVYNSGEARLKLLTNEANAVSQQLRELHDSSLKERKALQQIEVRYVQVLSKKDQLFRAMADTMPADQLNQKLSEFNVRHNVEDLQLDYAKRMTGLEDVNGRIESALRTLADLSASRAEALERGVKSELATVDAKKTELAGTAIPDSESLSDAVQSLENAVDAQIEQQKVTLSKLNSVMPVDSFIGNTTTTGLFGETARKTVLPIDEALKAYHQDKGRATLLKLQAQIDTYLSSSTSRRVPYVLLLQSQVKAALETVA